VASQRQAPVPVLHPKRLRVGRARVAADGLQTFSECARDPRVDESERVLADLKVRAVPKDAGHCGAGIRYHAVAMHEDNEVRTVLG